MYFHYCLAKHPENQGLKYNICSVTGFQNGRGFQNKSLQIKICRLYMINIKSYYFDKYIDLSLYNFKK